jgi:uncharacterized protein YggE
VRVETDDIEHASELARAAVRAGASEATSIRFALSDWSGMVTEALTMAANCAWESAEALAMASERTLGQVVSATTRLESQRGSLQGPIWHFERSPEQSAESAPVIPSPLEVEQRVEMVFELL